MNTFRIITASLAMSLSVFSQAQNVSRLGAADMQFSGSKETGFSVRMKVDPSTVSLGRDQLLKVTPMLKSPDGQSVAVLEPYAIAGRNQYFYTIRNNGDSIPVYRAGGDATYPYSVHLDWEDWMNEATLVLDASTSACCGKPVGEEAVPVGTFSNIEPPALNELNYVEPFVTDTKEFALEGRAYVNFPVNRIEIFPEYMNNPAELRKITSSIDTVKDNPDATIRTITLTGYASPEGPYLNNVRLAKGRTESVRKHVAKIYDFPDSVYVTASVPEDWAGLRESIEKSDLPMRDRMLSFIDSGYPVETRNDRFRALFPQDYQWLLKNIYPWLRHTDYLIEYTVRKYTDVDEIRRVMKTRPQNLSLDEFYLLAQSYPVGSDEYNEVFDVAVRMYPDVPVANLNAAYSAMSRGDYVSARKFLEKAGGGNDAEYARAMLEDGLKNYDEAISILEKIGTPKAKNTIEKIKAKKDRPKGSVVFFTNE